MGRMPRCGVKGDSFKNFGSVYVNLIRKIRRDNRINAINACHETGFIADAIMSRITEKIIFGSRKDISGIREGRNPDAILQACVPPHVINMQMGEKNKIDIFWSDASAHQIFKPHGLQVIEIQSSRSSLAIPGPRIHKNVPTAILDEPAMNAQKDFRF